MLSAGLNEECIGLCHCSCIIISNKFVGEPDRTTYSPGESLRLTHTFLDQSSVLSGSDTPVLHCFFARNINRASGSCYSDLIIAQMCVGFFVAEQSQSGASISGADQADRQLKLDTLWLVRFACPELWAHTMSRMHSRHPNPLNIG